MLQPLIKKSDDEAIMHDDFLFFLNNNARRVFFWLRIMHDELIMRELRTNIKENKT